MSADFSSPFPLHAPADSLAGPIRLALYQPDIAQNAGNMIRTAAGLGVGVDLIEPCGFVLEDKKLKRAGMDYLERAAITRHASWPAFLKTVSGRRLILLTTQGAVAYTDFCFQAGDTLVTGTESAGAPDEVHQVVFAEVRIPMRAGLRSLNVAAAAAMVLGEVLRQTGGFPKGA